MNFFYLTSFQKSYNKLSVQQKEKTKKALGILSQDPYAPSLHNHMLQGKLKGVRSISAGFDLRILFRQTDTYTIILLIEVGTHNQVYK